MPITRRTLLVLIAFSLAMTSLSGLAQQVIATIPVGVGPVGGAVDPGTNQIYVINNTDGTAMDIDGFTNTVKYTVNVGPSPQDGDVNRVTQKGYISNRGSNSVTVIDLTSGNPTTVTVGANPQGVAVNPVTNKIYVANRGKNDGTTVSVIDGATNQVSTITVGNAPRAVAVNQVTNRIYVSNRGSSQDGSDSSISVIDGATSTVIKTIPATFPNSIAVNPLTNQIYVNNQGSNYVTIIDGATNDASNVTVGFNPQSIAADQVTNRVYVANYCADMNCQSGSVSVIDGASDSVVQTVTVGVQPASVGVDVPTNKIYVVNQCGNDPNCLSAGTVTMIDGATYSTTTVNVGTSPQGVAVNPVTNRIYVANYGSNNVSVIGGASATALQFVAVTPCRVVDTRNTGGPIPGGTSRNFLVPQEGGCNIPTTAAAYSLNVTVVPPGPLGYLTIWPTGEDQPVVSTMNSLDGRVKANAAIVPAGYQGAVSVFVSNTSDVVLDIDGYFAPVSNSTLAFYPLTPCRVADTRNPNGPLGGPYLSGGVPRDFPILQSNCMIPNSAQAYSFNFTAVPRNGNPLGYLTVWPAGQSQPLVSTLNAPTGTVVANAAIVPAGTGGDIDVFASNDSDLVIDVNGYFAPTGQGALSLYPVAPCRVLDTRNGNGQFSGKIVVDVVDSVCGPSNLAQAYVFNATVVPPAPLGYLTLWPDGGTQPVVSTLNALDGAITSNMAIVPTNNGSIDAFASNLTQLVLDISSYFAP